MRKGALIVACALLATAPAWAGTVYYGGFTGETGYPYNAAGLSGAETTGGAVFQWVGQNNGFWQINSTAGRKKGWFGVDSAGPPPTQLTIPNGGNYTMYAAVEIPASGTFTLYDSTTSNKRFYCGVEFVAPAGGGNDQCGVAGIEWSIANSRWELRSDADGVIGGGISNFTSGTKFETRTVKDAANLFVVEYRKDYGTWTYYPAAVPQPFAAGTISGFALDDAGIDIPAFSVRGPWKVYPVLLTGTGVTTNLNNTADFDGDGTVNAFDPFPADSAYEVDSDADGLPDEWEILYIGDLSENGSSNNDNDLINNFAEFAGGFDPTLQDGPGLPAVGMWGRVMMISALAFFGLAAMAFRFRKAHSH